MSLLDAPFRHAAAHLRSPDWHVGQRLPLPGPFVVHESLLVSQGGYENSVFIDAGDAIGGADLGDWRGELREIYTCVANQYTRPDIQAHIGAIFGVNLAIQAQFIKDFCNVRGDCTRFTGNGEKLSYSQGAGLFLLGCSFVSIHFRR